MTTGGASIKAALAQQNHYFNRVINDRKTQAKADLIGHLVNAQVDGAKLSDSLLRSALELLISASFQTSTHMLSHCVIQLARHPDLLQQLRTSPALIPDFVEEMLRYKPPGHCVFRKTTQAISLAGISLQKGDVIIGLLASANRDPAQFDQPENFMMGRHNSKQQLAFGHGIHTCIGATLARMQVQIALETLLKTFSNISCPSDDDILWSDSVTIHGPKELPLTFE